MNILIPIAVLFVVMIPVFFLIKNLHANHESAQQSAKLRLLEQQSVIDEQRQTIKAISHVLNQTVGGGISKRLNENIEITELIYRLKPELFSKDSNLIYLLHAHDQFFMELATAATPFLESHVIEFIDIERNKNNRGQIFFDIYSSAGMYAPEFAKYRQEHLKTDRATVNDSAKAVGDYWYDSANRLADDLAGCDSLFISTGSLDDITNKVGGWFAALSQNTRASILKTMRQMNPQMKASGDSSL